MNSPETIIILRALSVFEQAYLQRSTNKLNELVAQSLAGGARSPPGMGEGLSFARMVVNELDAAKFDPLLIKSVAKIVKTSLETLLTRIDPLVGNLKLSLIVVIFNSLQFKDCARQMGDEPSGTC